MNNNETVDKTTTYTWAGTQQATKSVSVNSVPSVVQSFAYNATGSMPSVTTTNYTSGTISSQSRVDYDYSSNGIRVKATGYTVDLQTSNFTLQTSTEYLIDETNLTGYAQSIAETTRNSSGQTTKRVVYTFGTDEITQTSYDSSSAGLPPTVSSLHFGHDAHTSVRVLFDATTAIVQAYTYAAYGDLLAIHNGLAQQVLASGTNGLESAALTRMLYNGESFDSRIGLLYLRARWYNGQRFTTLDPFSGIANDPLSFHKYGFVHGDPVMGTDPTGRILLGGFSVSGISNGLRAMGMPTFAAAFRGVAAFGGQAARFLGPKLLDLVKNMWLPTGSRYLFSGPFSKWFTTTITTYLARGGFTLGQGLITNSVLDENIGPVISSLNSLSTVASGFQGELGGVRGMLIASGASIAAGRMQEVLDKMKFQNTVVDPLVTGQFGALAKLGIFAHGIVQFQTQLGLLNEALTQYIQIGYDSLDNNTRAKIDQRFGIQGGIQEIAIVPSPSTVIDAALGSLDPHREIDLLTVILRQVDQGGNLGAANDLITLIERMKNKYGGLEVNGRAI